MIATLDYAKCFLIGHFPRISKQIVEKEKMVYNHFRFSENISQK